MAAAAPARVRTPDLSGGSQPRYHSATTPPVIMIIIIIQIIIILLQLLLIIIIIMTETIIDKQQTYQNIYRFRIVSLGAGRSLVLAIN
jgi:hypothetical protein